MSVAPQALEKAQLMAAEVSGRGERLAVMEQPSTSVPLSSQCSACCLFPESWIRSHPTPESLTTVTPQSLSQGGTQNGLVAPSGPGSPMDAPSVI